MYLSYVICYDHPLLNLKQKVIFNDKKIHKYFCFGEVNQGIKYEFSPSSLPKK